jgi:peptide/nickel transport system substrate-binding protein
MATSRWRRSLLLAFGSIACLLIAACAQPPSAPAQRETSAGSPAAQTQPRGTIKIAWAREPETLNPKFLPGGGAGDYTWLFSAAFTTRDMNYVAHPMLAERFPNQTDGSWVINPDGTMVTTWRIRENARWHDGVPITAHDFQFAYEVYTDDAMPVGVRAPESIISRVDAPDEHTVVIYWKELYPGADSLGYRQMHPMAAHVYEEKYRTNHANFATGEEWTTGFVGSGPYKIDRWDPGSRMIARAHTQFFLGSPKVETLEIRFISDPNTVLANMLSGEVDLTSSPTINAPEASVAQDQLVARGEAYIKSWYTRLSYVDFQFREVPGWERAVSDLRVRRALMHGIDRQALNNVINLGLSPVGDAYVAPGDPLFGEVDRAITKYPYDPNRSAALLAEAGWQRGSGGVLTNGGQPFELQMWSDQENDASIISDNWKSLGINATPFRVPNARRNDQEFRNFFPGTQMGMNTISQEDVHTVSAKLPKADLGWLGSNRGSFSDPEVDRLHHVLITSLNEDERRQAVVGLHQRLTDQVAFGPLFYSYEALIARNNIKGPLGVVGAQTGITWNVYEWEVD